MKISLSLDIETPMLSIVPMPHEPKRPVMIHDSRFIAQMMDRALRRTSSHATSRPIRLSTRPGREDAPSTRQSRWATLGSKLIDFFTLTIRS
jgi:hypothetical protein